MAEPVALPVDRRRRLLQCQRQPPQLLRQFRRLHLVIGRLAAARVGRLQQKGDGGVRGQHIQFQRLDMPGETVESAGQHDMSAGEPAHQPVRLRQRGSRVQIVEDQQPAGIGVQRGEGCVEPYLFFRYLVFRQLQGPGQICQIAPQSLGRIGLHGSSAV
jgi:hypothetical protein